jgi:hypothetical protein
MSARAFTILDAISDQRLFGAAFRDLSTWRAWRAFLAGRFGIAIRRLRLRFIAPARAALGFLIGLSARRGWFAGGVRASRSSWP